MTETVTLGHNNPPADVTFSLHVDDLFTTLSDTLAGGEVSTDEQEAAIDAILDDFRKAKGDSDKLRAAEKKPFDDAAKAVQAKWKPIMDKADRGAAACKEVLTPYRTAKRRAVEEAARIAREEAAAKAKAAQDALRAADDLEAKFAAEEALKQAEKQSKAASKIERAPTGLRTYWTAEVTDRKAALLHYIARNPEAFAALIQNLADQDARGTRPPVPGVTFTENKEAR